MFLDNVPGSHIPDRRALSLGGVHFLLLWRLLFFFHFCTKLKSRQSCLNETARVEIMKKEEKRNQIPFVSSSPFFSFSSPSLSPSVLALLAFLKLAEFLRPPSPSSSESENSSSHAILLSWARTEGQQRAQV